jgi:CHAT domain-containing protein
VPPARALYRAIVAPVADLLHGAREIIIVPDGALFYLPFEALVADSDATEFLIERYAVSYAPSASGLERPGRRMHQPGRVLLALGNPDLSDPGQARSPAMQLLSGLPFRDAVVRDGRFVPLPHAATEVRRIRRGLGRGAASVYVGRRATESLLKRSARDFRIIHLATHFVLDDRQPLYSGLALAPDPDGGEDGFLQTYEVFNLDFNADLVVLSACNTALGRLSRGEGLVGTTRAFQYAGVPSLVVSLWSVDDAATSRLMQAFYRGLKAGRSKPAALREAKLEQLRAGGAKADPYYWAPFILIGDPGPLALPAGSAGLPVLPIALAAVVGLALALAWRRRARRT